MGVRGWRGIGVMYPELPFLLLPLPSGPDEENEAPSQPLQGDQTPILSQVMDIWSVKQRLGVEGSFRVK